MNKTLHKTYKEYLDTKRQYIKKAEDNHCVVQPVISDKHLSSEEEQYYSDISQIVAFDSYILLLAMFSEFPDAVSMILTRFDDYLQIMCDTKCRLSEKQRLLMNTYVIYDHSFGFRFDAYHYRYFRSVLKRLGHYFFGYLPEDNPINQLYNRLLKRGNMIDIAYQNEYRIRWIFNEFVRLCGKCTKEELDNVVRQFIEFGPLEK